MKPILEIQNIGKKFMINHEKKPYLSLRDGLNNILKAKPKKEAFWALKDISFNVQAGESIGIIGKNGAGKSTLLKILSKITPPSTGKIISRGRIASLLEVGTGFHPELSGRENVFMNGSILGMNRKEIVKNFDAIVEFSGVNQFIDTPLKHYSSGMQLRLAFAVAAFLENEILIIDEVLAVGDAEFQKKCMGKMKDVSKSGRTVLFVSHNIGAVKQLCNSGILLSGGKITSYGKSEDVINNYLLSYSNSNYKIPLTNESNIYVNILSLELVNHTNDNFSIKFDDQIMLKLVFRTNIEISNFSVGFGLTTIDQIPLFTVRSENNNSIIGQTIEVITSINHNLRAGHYSLALGIANGNFSYYYKDNVAQLEILNYGETNYNSNNHGLINCESSWEITKLN